MLLPLRRVSPIFSHFQPLHCPILAMARWQSLFMLSVVLPLITTLHAEIQNHFRARCSNDSHYGEGTDFQSNLNTVMQSLVQNTYQTRFNISVYGRGPDQVYGLLQCRGDTTVEQCKYCSQDANISIRGYCGNAVNGIIWLDQCYLRYGNSSFIGILDIDHWWFNYETDDVSSPDVFNKALQDLFTDLSNRATYGSNTLYASGTTNDFSPKIYALVQCRRDMLTGNCKTCLSTATTRITKEHRGSIGVRGYSGSCIARYELYSFFGSPAPAEAPANKSVVTSLSNSTHSSKIHTILGAVAGGFLLVLLVGLFTTRRRLKSAIFGRRYEVNEQVEEHTLVDEDCQIHHEQAEEDLLVTEDRQILNFKMETLIAATNNFHDDNKLGEGGFGPVYKATTHDGKELAVKKLSINSKQGKKEFLTEVKLVAKIQHRNLVKLLGCCAQGTERLLVYEYLPNSSLDKILFDPIKRKMLDWKKRYNIILGVVRGLLYLHEDSQPRIIHRDIKASNILLDENLNPKIADFGLAKLLPQDESCVSTLTKVAGTLGYMAPEYAMHGQLSAKADVYSFGVLLMELVTGRKNMDYNLPPEMQILLGWAWRSYEAGNSVEIIDPVAIIENGDEEQALKCIQVAIWCTQADPSLRPTMFTVSSMLSSLSVMVPYLTKPVCANSVPRFNTSNSGSGYRLSHHSSATTSSTLSDPVPASSSNATVSTIELVRR